MTVIAWDGKTLAADKRSNFGGLHATVTKIHRLLDGSLVGCAGNAAQGIELIQWLIGGAAPDAIPAIQRDPEKCVQMLVIRPGGQVLQYDNAPFPMVLENRQWAIGSGRDFAMTAMHLGHCARVAVEVACALDLNCGNSIDTLEI